METILQAQEWGLKEAVRKRGQKHGYTKSDDADQNGSANSEWEMRLQEMLGKSVGQHMKDIKAVGDAAQIDGPHRQGGPPDTEESEEHETTRKGGRS